MNRIRSTLLSIALVVPLIVAVGADAGPAIGSIEGSRAATAAEKQFIARMVTAFEKALPPLPAGWEFNETHARDPDMGVGVDSEKNGLSLGYTWHISSQEREKKESLLLKKLEDNQNARRDESGLPKGAAPIQARMDEVAAKLGEAAGKGDNATVQKYAAELEKLGKQMTAAQDGAAVPLGEQRKIVADTRAQINISINVRHASLPGDAMLLGATSGASFVFRSERDPNDTETQREGYTTLLYGPWKKNATDDGFEVRFNPAKKYPSVQSVTVVIQADAKRAEALARTLNAAEIQGWLK
jgi:hypothetical protein